jgi:hypothetical protein
MWCYIMIGAFFIAIGLAVQDFKWYFLIAGYNTIDGVSIFNMKNVMKHKRYSEKS